MSDSDSIALWYDRLQSGDAAAAGALWERYFPRLVGLARAKLTRLPRKAAADEEDVALSAFDSFCRAAGEGRLPRLNDRHDLWALLVTMTERKIYALVDRETAKKRGGGAVRGDSAFGLRRDTSSADGLGQLPGREPTPEFAAAVAEECERLLATLRNHDEGLPQFAVLKLEGYSNEEIAEQRNCSLATVERKLRLIRTLWAGEVAP